MSQPGSEPDQTNSHDQELTSQARPLAGGACLLEPRPGPCLICIVGASGDLTARKLMPSLYHLFKDGRLHKQTAVVGASRTAMNDQSFRVKMRAAIQDAGYGMEAWEEFAGLLHYQPLDYEDVDSFKSLGERLIEVNRSLGCQGNRLFNLALPPKLHEPVAANLAAAGLVGRDKEGNGFSRLVVEKPFGRDLESSRRLSRALAQAFHEDQIFRIDHYLAKDTVQNLFLFRFANTIFEPLWNRNYIERVSIVATESVGVGSRAGYYEQAGVLRDMFQNHMMQLLALVAAEPPSLFEAERVRDEKVKLFRSLRPFPVADIYDYLALGQYAKGEIEGGEAPAYRNEPRVDPASLTPTFACLKIFVDNWRWQGVPFYILSGKRLARKLTRIEIQFKEPPQSLWRQQLGEFIPPNRLVLDIQPKEDMRLVIQSKRPGSRFCLRTVAMSFDFITGREGPRRNAYEKVLVDALVGDHTLFWRQDGVEKCWEFLDPILNECESCRDRAGHLHRYPAGSWGPEAAREIAPHLWDTVFQQE